MSDIYKRHESAFSSVSAYVVLLNGERVATIAYKFPKDGAGRLYCYAHWLGTEMTRGHANGYGYDKKSAAAADAAKRMKGAQVWDKTLNNGFGGYAKQTDAPSKDQAAFIAALADDNGWHCDRRLQNAGFVVLQAV